MSASHQKILGQMQKEAYDNLENISFVAGPLPLKDSTKKLQQIIDAIFDPNVKVDFFYRHPSDELFAKLSGASECTMSITDILKDYPDFSHIEVTSENLNRYTDQINKKLARLKTQMNDKLTEFCIASSNTRSITSEVKQKNLNLYTTQTKYNLTTALGRFIPSDIKNDTNLHIGEIYAINIYTRDLYYPIINSFLRENGSSKSAGCKYLSSPEIFNRIIDILLTIVIATQALNRLEPKIKAKLLYRTELDLPQTIQEKIILANQQMKLFSNNGFLSTSMSSAIFDEKSLFANGVVYMSMIENKLGKPISNYSQFNEEAEVLFYPSTPFVILAASKKSEALYIVAMPTRALAIEKKSISQVAMKRIYDRSLSFLNEVPCISLGFFANKSIQKNTNEPSISPKNDRSPAWLSLRHQFD